MSRYFVDDPPAPIYEFEPGSQGDREPNVILIRARMDEKTRAAVANELAQTSGEGKQLAITALPGNNTLALLIHNILGWRGPDFDGVPCDRKHIELLDRTEPLIEQVINAIGERNAPKSSPIPNSPAGSGSSSGGKPDSRLPAPAPSLSQQLATGIGISPLRSALDGRLGKSENSTPTTSKNS